ncbi:MAG: NAD(P)-dependent oxidoreductase [Verrucomicrobiota bacterium]|nr:NAD(P)-dependent oxidoreductase [Verrucomicrobiota bacterium]
MDKASTNIGFVGTGVMGSPMAAHILKEGYKLYVYNRTSTKAQSLIDSGAHLCENPGQVAKNCDVIFAIVGFPQDVESVFLGSDGIVENAKSGAIIVDMTTSRPALAKKIANIAAKKGIQSLDAPVSGGDIGARSGSLSIMVGGERDAYDQIFPLFQLMGENVVYHGPAGSGQHTKMANQIAIASTMLAMCESLTYAKKAGLDPQAVLKSISNGAAGSWTLDNLAPRILREDYEPGFFVKHFIKDMQIAIDSGESMGVDISGLKIAKTKFDQIAEEGFLEKGTQSLIKAYE